MFRWIAWWNPLQVQLGCFGWGGNPEKGHNPAQGDNKCHDVMSELNPGVT